MTQLTEERFEQILSEKLAPLVTKDELQTAVRPLATKEDVSNEVRAGVEELARMVAEGFNDIRERLDVRERLTVVEQKLHRVEEALHITL